MTPEIVESWPYLLGLLTILSNALKTPGLTIESLKMFTFLVPIQVILSDEAYCPLTVRNIAFEGFIVYSSMFAGGKILTKRSQDEFEERKLHTLDQTCS
jgi:hypothetical protein